MLADPWELLRQARDEIVDLWRDTDCSQHLKADCSTCLHQTTALDRIDAALKEYDASVEWSNPYFGPTHFANVGNASISVTKDWSGGSWWWTISRIIIAPTEGHARTEEEAKAAAIAAARKFQ